MHFMSCSNRFLDMSVRPKSAATPYGVDGSAFHIFLRGTSGRRGIKRRMPKRKMKRKRKKRKKKKP